jgi:hypothetical protein
LYLGTLIAEESEGQGAEELALAGRDAHELGLYRTEAMALAIEARVHLIRAGVVRPSSAGASSDEPRDPAGAAPPPALLGSGEELSAADSRSASALERLERHGAELRDGIVVTGTRAMVLHHTGRDDEAQPLVRELRRTMRRANQAIEDTNMRRLHRRATTSLLAQVLSPEGPIFPRG